MTTLREGRHTAEFILSEGDGFISRDQITVASGSGKVSASTILATGANGKFVPLINGDPETDPLAVPAGILYANVDATAADVMAVAVKRFCEVKSAELIYPAGAVKATVNAGLAAIGIIVR